MSEGYEGIKNANPENPAEKVNFEMQQVELNMDALKADLERADDFPKDEKKKMDLINQIFNEQTKLEELQSEQLKLAEMERQKRSGSVGNA